MRWHYDSITQGEIAALRKTAEYAWAEDTRYPIASGGGDSGQCYVTAVWLKERLGGNVGRCKGHYAWLSPDNDYVLDIAPHTGQIVYEENTRFKPIETIPNGRTQRFARRANDIFDHLSKVIHFSLDYMGDALPGQEPQRETENGQQDSQYWHDEPGFKPAAGSYKFVYANGALEVSPFHDHDQLLAHTGVSKDHKGPIAMGHATVGNNKATWEVASNMNVKGLERIFKDYTKHVGWQWGGITNIEGEPISDEFAPKGARQLHFAFDQGTDHLWIGNGTLGSIAAKHLSSSSDVDIERMGTGILYVTGRQAHLLYSRKLESRAVRHLSDFCEDRGYLLYLSGNDNQLKVIPDLQQFNNGDPNAQNPDEHQYPAAPMDERSPAGIYKCPVCRRLFPGWDEYADHRRIEAEDAGSEINEESSRFPELPNKDDTFPAHFTEQQPSIMPVARSEAERVETWDGLAEDGDQFFVAYKFGSPVAYSKLRGGKLLTTHGVDLAATRQLQKKVVKYAEKEPKDLLPAPMPFIYDIQDDAVTLGEPGSRTSDIPGKFTPGGIVEGVYEPGGKILIKTLTNMPYSIRHVIDLWYYQHPELSVTGVFLQDDSGKTTKLASADIGGYITALVASEPAVHTAAKALEGSGGQVFAVGGAVRDAMMGKEPKDIDLMVTGLQPAEVNAALRDLPGTVITTGKDFGVFRYKEGRSDVEIALPRRERSTGGGHKDFDVQADPSMRPEEDLFRRDFTANAMAVNLRTGALVDPYNGADDIQNGVLRSHNPESLSEDPLRVVRGLVANSRHGLVPDDATKQQMGEAAPSLTHLPQERVQAELDKLFAGDHPANAIRLAHETGVLRHILPEVDEAFGYDQNNPHHEFELGDHITNVLERVSEKTDDPDVRLAALLHDIGKPGSQWTDPETGKSHFYKKRMEDGSFLGDNHEELGARMTNSLMNRLRYPNDRTQRVTDLVNHHMFAAFTSQKGARKFLQRVGDHADDLMNLRWADQGGKSAYPNTKGKEEGLTLDKQKELIDQVRQAKQPTNQAALAVDGNDLIAAGISPGPQMGQLLQTLTDAVINDPALNQRDTLLQMVRSNGV